MTLHRDEGCAHGRASAAAVARAVAATRRRLEPLGVRAELFERPAGATRLYIRGVAPFRVSEQRCREANSGRCPGFLFGSEFYAELTEAAVGRAILEVAGLERSGRRERLAAMGCCGTGCPDCPY